VGILNSCVYSFYGGLYHPDCEDVLQDAMDTITSGDFASSVDGLLDVAMSKLADDGKM
jgi:hypothetical protein